SEESMKKNTRKWFLISLIAMLTLSLMLSLSCAKSSGGGTDDEGDDDTGDDDTAGDSNVGDYTVFLNMVPVEIGAVAEAAALTVFDAEGEDLNVEGVLLSDFLAGIAEFAADAEKFTYEFLSRFDDSTLDAGLVDYTDLATVAFYADPDMDRLCLGWIEAGHADHALCDMDNGALVTHPIAGQWDFQTIQWVDDRTDDQPTHLGEEAAIQAVVTAGTGVIVAGSYMKAFVQENGYGLKLFADMGATEDNQGYDGQLFSEIYLFEGDEVFVQGRITVHDGMIEFVPVSGYHVAVLSTGNAVPDPVTKTIDDLTADPYRWAGALVRVDDVEMVDVNPDDPTTDWPEYATKSKDIRIRHAAGGVKIGLPIYEGTGIPGSRGPEGTFDVAGVFNIDGETFLLYPRMIEDVNPADDNLAGSVTVAIYGEERQGVVNLALLPAGMQQLEDVGDPVPVVSIASIVRASGIARNYKRLEYKPVAYDDRKPFETLIYDEMKSGVLYQGDPTEPDEPDPMLNSHFWDGMYLSDIYFLNGITDVQAFREIEPPEEGDAVHGEGVTLMINGQKYNMEFSKLPKTEYEGQQAIAIKEFLSDAVIGLFTMDGSFTVEQIKVLYDYRLLSYDESDEAIVRYDDLADGYLILADPPYTVFPSLGASARVDDLYVIDMMRFIEVDDGVSDPIPVYLRDCATENIDVGEGVFEDVVFFSAVLEEAGIDTSAGMYLFDFWLVASDDFVSYWTYGHNHLVDMYYRPYENRGWTADPDIATYGGRVSTKGIKAIELHDVPQEAPSEAVVIDEETLWGSSADSCEGCHYKHEAIQIPIDCYACHAAP
ncbi:MAG: hypothetical protein ACTSXZ_05620, partial [Alphaproteobacteria bacterium]